MDKNIVFSICHLPSGDGNFVSRLKKATEEEIRCAIEEMKNDPVSKHKSRILACERELRKRNKNK